MNKEIELSKDGSLDYVSREGKFSQCLEKAKKKLFTARELREMRLAFICEYGEGINLFVPGLSEYKKL